MKIAVNTRLLLKNRLEGIGWVTYETLRRIVASHPDDEFFFIFDREPDPTFIFAKNVHPVVILPRARHPFLYIWYFEISMTRALNKIKPDIFLSMDGYLSLRTKTKEIAVFHDLNFEHFPKDMPRLALWHYKKFFPKFAHRADRIITVSEFSKKDICECYSVNPDKISVVYNGANEKFLPIDENNKTIVREQFTNGKPYFLFVGSLHPRKNLARLFPAFDKFKDKSASDIKLLIVGEKRWWTEPIREAFDKMTHKDDVVFCGHLLSDDLHRVTAAALASVYVSYFEGFGIPIVEAFRCGTPVITSNVTSMPEIAGNAALLVNPFDVDDIADALLKILDGDLREKLIEAGYKRKDDFSWDKAADGIWKVIENALKHNPKK